MRTVTVILKQASLSLVENWLNGFAAHQGDRWFYPSSSSSGVVLFINIDQDLRGDWNPETPDAYDQLTSILGEEPTLAVYADVSGRFPGDAEARLFVTSILHQFQGVAVDDYADHWWTVDEVEHNTIVDGLHFFDYLEAFRRDHPGK